MKQRPTHDLSWRLADRLVAIIENCLRPEEIGKEKREFYDAIKDELAKFFESWERERQRLKAEKSS